MNFKISFTGGLFFENKNINIFLKFIINSSSVSQFKDLYHRKIQNLTMSSIFNVDHHGMKEICILSFSAENWGKVWFFG